MYQCLLFALFLVVFKRRKRRGNVLLATFLVSHAAIPLDNLINFGTAFRAWAIDFSPNIFYVFGTAYWLEGPLLLFYVRAMIYKDYHLKRVDWLYFLPFVIYVCWESYSYYQLDFATKVEILKGYDTYLAPDYTRAIGAFRELFRFALGVMCVMELVRYQRQIKNEFADIERIDLTWLKVLVIGFLLIRADAILVNGALISSVQFKYFIDFELLGLASNYTVMLLITALIFFNLGFSRAFEGIQEPVEEKIPEKSSINPEQVQLLERYMSEKKPYLNCLLNLDNLAGQLHMSPRALSTLINRHYEQNFFDFINTYRIDECKLLLSDPSAKSHTMLEVMENAGFNSKATFNTFFKKKVGLTPSEYRQKMSGQ